MSGTTLNPIAKVGACVMAEQPENSSLINSLADEKRVVEHVLRYELYRHRDITERLSQLLGVDQNPDAFNRSTWDILYFLMQSRLQGETPNVTDIYLATGLSKGTAITGLAELERRGAISKVQDREDARRRRIDISDSVAHVLEAFVAECGELDFYPPELNFAYLGAGGDLLKLLGGLLHLGDVSFVKLRTSEGGVSDEGCNIAPEAAAALANAEGLLGVAGLARTLTVRIVRAGGGRSSVYKVPLDVAKAEAFKQSDVDWILKDIKKEFIVGTKKTSSVKAWPEAHLREWPLLQSADWQRSLQ